MYTAHVDTENQRFVILNSDGAPVAERSMPAKSWPNPGRKKLMSEKANLHTWGMIKDLVEAANRVRDAVTEAESQ